jgi:hypothetical protein
MRQINVPVEDAVYVAAKVAAAARGMLFRVWVARALMERAMIDSEPGDWKRGPGMAAEPVRERREVPFEDL